MNHQISIVVLLSALAASPGLSAHPPIVSILHADAQAQAGLILKAGRNSPASRDDLPNALRIDATVARDSAQSQARLVLDPSTPVTSVPRQTLARDGGRGVNPQNAIAGDAQSQAQRMLRAGNPSSENVVRSTVILAAH